MATLNPIQAFAEHVMALVEAKLKAEQSSAFALLTAMGGLITKLQPILAKVNWQATVTDLAATMGISTVEATEIMTAITDFMNLYNNLTKPPSST